MFMRCLATCAVPSLEQRVRTVIMTFPPAPPQQFNVFNAYSTHFVKSSGLNAKAKFQGKGFRFRTAPNIQG